MCSIISMYFIERKILTMNLFGIVAQAAEGAATGTSQTGGTANLLGTFLPLILLIVLFYFMLIRPQRKRDKETKAMLDALKVGDKVVTVGGICGKVSKIKDNYVFIETGNIGTQDEKSVIKMERSAIKSVEQKITN